VAAESYREIWSDYNEVLMNFYLYKQKKALKAVRIIRDLIFCRMEGASNSLAAQPIGRTIYDNYKRLQFAEQESKDSKDALQKSVAKIK
jgi:hypothetical protein